MIDEAVKEEFKKLFLPGSIIAGISAFAPKWLTMLWPERSWQLLAAHTAVMLSLLLVCIWALKIQNRSIRLIAYMVVFLFVIGISIKPIRVQRSKDNIPTSSATTATKTETDHSREQLSLNAFVEKYNDGKQDLVVSATNTGVIKLVINRAELICSGKVIGIADEYKTQLRTWLDPGEPIKYAVPYFLVPGPDRNKSIDGRDCHGKLSVRVFTSRATVASSQVKR